ncbi:ribonuclease H-like domain-containing protein [Tanacetum coccineum]
MASEDDNINSGDSSKKSICTSSDLNLSFGDSLYMHPNDTGGSPIVIFDAMFLMGLDDSYLAIRSNILTRDPLPLVKATFAIEPNPNLKCTNCNKIGHIMDRCFELVGYPAGYVKKNFIPNTRPMSSNNTSADIHSNNASSSTTSNSHVYLSNEHLARLMNLLNNNGVSTANANMLVGHPNGTQALITKIIDLKINIDITLYDVFVVPEYTVSLLSFHKLSRDSKLFVDFDESNCYIQNLKANRTVGIGRQFTSFSLFDVDNACKIVSNIIIVTCFVSKTLWHQRLCHPADQVLNVLKTTLSLDSHSTPDHLCNTCNKAKQTREPFPLSDHKSSKIGRVSSNDDGTELSPDNHGNDDSETTSMDETNNTHPEGNVSDETDFINDFYEIERLPVNTVRRSSRQTKLPTSLNDFVIKGKVKYGIERVVSYANLNHENYCFASTLNKNHTCDIIDLPSNRKAISNKWIWKIKYKSNGEIDRYKARLVAKGFNQKEGIDFDEIFSPVVKMSTVRYEEIYMTIPQGFVNKDNKTKVCRLVKSLYGLKQAPRKWNEKLVNFLKENDFVQFVNDHSLFTKSKNNKFIALLVYVDDIVVTGNCKDEIDKFKTFLKSKFQIKDLGHLKYFLEIEVIKTNKDLCLTQRKYCLELLKEYGLLGCKPVSTSMEPNSVLPYIATKDDSHLDNITGYQKLLGKLIYLTHTRLDIAYSVHCLAQYMHSPLKSHLKYALNVLRYFKNAPEAEYRSLSFAACEIIGIQKLLFDLKIKVTLPVDLLCDNKSTLQLAVNSVFYERPKHFKIDVHFIKEKITKGILNTKKICSLNQIADILTKHLPVYQHKFSCEKLDILSQGLKMDMLILGNFKLCVLILMCQVGVSWMVLLEDWLIPKD